MDKMYFILRVKESCCGFYYGNLQELESILYSRLGVEITGEGKFYFERIGLEFKRRIKTRMDVYGENKVLYNEIMDDIVRVFENHGVKISRRNTDDMYDLKRYAMVCSVFSTDLLEILISDGVFHRNENCGYIGVYDAYKPLSEFSEDWIWDKFNRLCGYSNPKFID